MIKAGSQVVRLGTHEIKIRKMAMMTRNGITPRDTSPAVALARFCRINRLSPSGGEIKASSIFITMITANHKPLKPSPVTRG